MTSKKRIVLANDSRLLREALHYALNKAEHFEVVQEIPDHTDLPSAIERFDPHWVILSLPLAGRMRNWIDARDPNSPSMHLIFFTRENDSLQLNGPGASEQNLLNLTLQEFIHLLGQDLQPA